MIRFKDVAPQVTKKGFFSTEFHSFQEALAVIIMPNHALGQPNPGAQSGDTHSPWKRTAQGASTHFRRGGKGDSAVPRQL